MTNIFRRALSVLCALALCFALLPAAALASGSGYGVKDFAFYYLYDGELPGNPGGNVTSPAPYGPSGDDVPFRLVDIDLDKLFSNLSGAKAAWESRKVITAADCGYDYYTRNAEWWSKVVSCMTDAEDRDFFTSDAFGRLFQGYVLKGDLGGAYPRHCDGIITEEPPLYLVEMQDRYDGNFIETLSSSSPQRVDDVKAAIDAYLRRQYGALNILWAGNSGTFNNGGQTFSFALALSPSPQDGGTLNYVTKAPKYYLATAALSLTPHYRVTYSANGGSGSVPEDVTTHESGKPVNVIFDPVPSRGGYAFLGWARNNTASEPEFTADGTKSFLITSDTTLYAVWRARQPALSIEKSVRFVSEDGPRDLEAGEKVTVGDILEYTVAVTNSGGPAREVLVADALLPAQGPIGGAQGRMTGDGYVIDSIGPGETAEISYRYTVQSSDVNGELPNTAEASVGGGEPVSAQCVVPTERAATHIEKNPVVRSPEELTGVTWKGGSAPAYTPADSSGAVTLAEGAQSVTLLYRISLTAVNTDAVTVSDSDSVYVGYSGEGLEGVTENSTGSVTVEWAAAGDAEAPAHATLFFTKTFTLSDVTGAKLTNSVDAETVADKVSDSSEAEVKYITGLEKHILPDFPAGVEAPAGLALSDLVQGADGWLVLLGEGERSAALLYEIVVKGDPGAKFTVTDEDATFIGSPSGTIGEGGEARVYCYKIFEDAASAATLTNTAQVLSFTAGASAVVSAPDGRLVIEPADLTIYMGGDDGYAAVVGGQGQQESTSLPEPLFYISLPGGGSADNIALSGAGGRSWTILRAGEDASGAPLYRIAAAKGQEPVRVQFTDGSGVRRVSDAFTPGGLGGLNAGYDISIYRGGAGTVTAVVDGRTLVASDGPAGRLEVRYVVDSAQMKNPVYHLDAAPESRLSPGAAALSAPEGTTYSLNDTSVPVDASGVALLFDELYDSDGSFEALRARVEQLMRGRAVEYEAKYLDLVDAQNGNAWVKASGNVTVYWAYPEGTDASTEFTLLHFTGLHRSLRQLSEDVISNWPDVDRIEPSRTQAGLSFEVTPGNFSPYVLVWSVPGDEPDGPKPPTPTPTPTPTPAPSEPSTETRPAPNWLNTSDHFAYIIGYEDGSVRPNAGITRAEVATIFFRLLTDEARQRFWSEESPYTDVDGGRWYNNAVSTLSRMGILGGYEDGSFRPDAGISRAEFAKIAVSFFDYTAGTQSAFADVAPGAWYARFVAAAAELGLIEGYGGGLFRPDAGITRAEACAIINRTLLRAPDKGHLLPEPQMNTWPDNADTSLWFYAHIQEATNSHAYQRQGDIEQWTAKLPERDWDALEYHA